MSQPLTADQRDFVERAGVLMEEFGHPRIGGRIVGWLLICEPPYQSFNDLVEKLEVSKGSVSSMTRLLVERGVLERFTLPGDRQTYFRVCPSAWTRLLQRQIRLNERLHELATGTLARQASAETPNPRLRNMAVASRLVLTRWPEVIEEYERLCADDGA